MTDKQIMEIAREEFDYQDRFHKSLATNLRFLFSITLVVVGANMALFKQVSATHNPETFLWMYKMIANANWVSLAIVFIALICAYFIRIWVEPRTFKHYLEWSSLRTAELVNVGYANCDAQRIAESDMWKMIKNDYLGASSNNRKINLRRQKHIALGTVAVIISTVLLGLQFMLVAYTQERNVVMNEKNQTSNQPQEPPATPPPSNVPPVPVDIINKGLGHTQPSPQTNHGETRTENTSK